MVTMIKESVKRMRNTREGNSMFKQPSAYLSLLFGALFLFAPNGKAVEAGQKIIPGMYEFLMLAADQKGEVTGFYRESQGEGVVKTCSFFLKGTDTGGQANLVTWHDQVFPGILKNESKNDINLKIAKGLEHPGCGLVLMPMIAEEGRGFTRIYASKWESLKIVKSDRAPLFSEPSADKKTKSYFIKKDVLGVVSVNGEWVNVEFPREGKAAIKGWLRSSDMQDLLPP